MSLPKVLGAITLLLFGLIGMTAVMKKGADNDQTAQGGGTIEIDLNQTTSLHPTTPSVEVEPIGTKAKSSEGLPSTNRIEELFTLGMNKLPIVETITYKSHADWMKGRPAWLVDYASHYKTSRHFIARSLNGRPDYLTQNVSEGDRFNILSQDKNFSFYLLVDASRCKMWFYYLDEDSNDRVLLKSYDVGLGRPNTNKESGLLTPFGKFKLGNNIAVYKPKMMGYHKGEKVEMMRIFGTRWIPFSEEIAGCTAPARGFGIHGAPWSENAATGELFEERDTVGVYESDGCIRLKTEDVEEIFSVIVSRPTVIEIVKDFNDAQPPGREVAL